MTPVQPQPMLFIPANFQFAVADITVAIWKYNFSLSD